MTNDNIYMIEVCWGLQAAGLPFGSFMPVDCTCVVVVVLVVIVGLVSFLRILLALLVKGVVIHMINDFFFIVPVQIKRTLVLKQSSSTHNKQTSEGRRLFVLHAHTYSNNRHGFIDDKSRTNIVITIDIITQNTQVAVAELYLVASQLLKEHVDEKNLQSEYLVE